MRVFLFRARQTYFLIAAPRADRRFCTLQADNGREPRTGPTGENSGLRSVDAGMYAALPTFDLNNRRTT
jgi:hypothetical protein